MEVLTLFFILLMPLIVIILVIILIKVIINKSNKSTKHENTDTYQNENTQLNQPMNMQGIEQVTNFTSLNPEQIQSFQEQKVIEEIFPYERKFLLTKNEWSFYRNLKPITDKYNLHILSKIRLEDIVQVKSGLNNSEKASARGRIKSRHIDFALARPDTLEVLLIIELDDRFHNIAKNKEIDAFKDDIFNKIGLPIIRTRGIANIESEICKRLNINYQTKGAGINETVS